MPPSVSLFIYPHFYIVVNTCAATMMNAPGGSSEFAPVNEKSRIGIVKYLSQGADFVVKSRREDAYKQMYSACQGKYKIEVEGPRAEGGVVIANSGILAETQYWYIQFSCIIEPTSP